MMLCYIHRSVLWPVIITEASSDSRCKYKTLYKKRESLNLRYPLDLSPPRSVNPEEGGRGDSRSQRGWRIPKEYGTPNQLSKVRVDSQRLKREARELTGVYTRSFANAMTVTLIFFFCETPNRGLFCFSWYSFLPIALSCLASVWGPLPCLTVSCFVLLGCCLLEFCSFLKAEWRGNGSKGRGG